MRQIFLAIIFLLFIQSLQSQTNDPNRHDHSHHLDHHKHHKQEIGIANALVYFPSESAFAYGIHLHYSYSLTSAPLGLGLGYERIFDEHGHNLAGIQIIYSPLDGLNLNLAPGIVFEDEHPDEIKPAVHLELSYEWPFHDVHIGPAVGFSWDPEDVHFSIGLHVGLGF